MLAHQQKIQFSSYSGLYDLIVPKDNFLRKINDLIDFSLIYDELLEKYCQNNGRRAESPIRMFKYLLLKTIFTVSDVDVVERSGYDMSFKGKNKGTYKIEPKNSELKNVHGYRRATSYGIENMEMQGALAIFTVNLKRILKLIN